METANTIVLDAQTYQQVTLLARAWSTTPAHAIGQLIAHFNATTATAPDQVAVYAIYNQVRIQGTFDPATGSLTVTDGPAQGRYKSPSGATTAVVGALRPGVTPLRSGWTFWKIHGTGERLDTLRAQLRRTHTSTRPADLPHPPDDTTTPAPAPVAKP